MIYAGGNENITKDMALRYAYEKGAAEGSHARVYDRKDFCPGYERHINKQSSEYIQDCIYAFVEGRVKDEKRYDLLAFVKSEITRRVIDIAGTSAYYHSDMPPFAYVQRSPFTKICIFIDVLLDDLIFNAYDEIEDDQLRMHFYAYSVVSYDVYKLFDEYTYTTAKEISRKYNNDVNITLALCIYGYDAHTWHTVCALTADMVESADLYCDAMRAKQQQPPISALKNIDLSIGGDDE